MGHHKLFYQDTKTIRETLNGAIEVALVIHDQERRLIQTLHSIDRGRLYVRYGFKSLTSFCRFGLKFSKTQAHRIATQVRRYEPTVNIVVEPLPLLHILEGKLLPESLLNHERSEIRTPVKPSGREEPFSVGI
ncbi:MAG: hypothetical protein ACXWC9_04490 [Pseudobdellovibrionaceae bacterium]